jgi:hypothetical protein
VIESRGIWDLDPNNMLMELTGLTVHGGARISRGRSDRGGRRKSTSRIEPSLTLTWFGRKWGVVVDFWREHRRLRLQLDHDKAMTTALQGLNEAAKQLKTFALNQRAAE